MTEYSDNLTPDQYRREGFRLGIEAAKEACRNIIKDYDVMEPGKPDHYASMKTQRAAKGMVRLAIQEISAIDVDEVLAKVEAVDPLIAAAITLRDALDGDERSNMHCLLLAACFGAERFDKMTASPITHDGAPKAMLHDLLTAIIDPNDPALDDLRACNQPTMTVTARPAPDALAQKWGE